MRKKDYGLRVNKLFHIKTFGCQMNEHDSLKISALIKPLGFEETADPLQADLVLFNTCTVRQKAHDKAFSEIGKVIAAEGKRPLIGVCGCMAQEEGVKLLHRFPEINLVFGPDQIYKLPELLEIVEKEKRPAIATELINSAEDYHFLDTLEATRLNGPTAYVTIMKGCNSHCSYCIVPKVRGTEVCRPARDIIRETEFLVEKGCKEVTLLGQTVNSYCNDGVSFAELIALISKNTGVARIRFTSPHPKDVKDDLIEEYGQNPKLCPHIHMPLQSGSDAVLKRMRRAYNTTTYSAKIEKLRAARPDIAISTDMIVGFPGESDAEFQQSLDFIKGIGLDAMYAFKYSPRPDTEAFGMADDVAREKKEERLQRLLDLQNNLSKSKNETRIGLVEEVLVEGADKKKRGRFCGRSSHNRIVNFAGQEGLIGAIVKVKITKAYSNSLEGELWKN